MPLAASVAAVSDVQMPVARMNQRHHSGAPAIELHTMANRATSRAVNVRERQWPPQVLDTGEWRSAQLQQVIGRLDGFDPAPRLEPEPPPRREAPGELPVDGVVYAD